MGEYSKAICKRINESNNTDPVIKALVKKPLIGSVEQFSDSTDILSNAEWRGVIRNLYDVEQSV
jgi:hypothetical protein